MSLIQYILYGVFKMVNFKALFGLKKTFSRLNPLNSFNGGDSDEEIISYPSSKKLLEMLINNYSGVEYMILISIYHLISTRGVKNEFLTVLSKDRRVICDLVKGNDTIVNTPVQVELECENKNILIATHNHFFGAIIPSLGDICKALKHNCNVISIVSENHIGIIILGYGKPCDEKFVYEFENFHGYLDICFNFEKTDVINKLELLDIPDDEKEKIKLEIYDKFISKNTEKFVNEFNRRLNKFNMRYI